MKRYRYRSIVGIRSGVIAVDVDNTLIGRNGECNEHLITWLRAAKADGKALMLWSARGGEYARKCADRLCIADLFDVIIGKPEMMIDDDLWTWTRYSRALHPSIFVQTGVNAAGPSELGEK